jgi:hypothetical protein
MRPPFSTLLIVVGTLLLPVSTHAIDLVVSCGQFFRGSAMLAGNLDCSSTDDDAVKLQGRLHLGGFTLTAHPAHAAVRCLKGACRIDGPGTITGGAQGVRSDKNARLVGVAVGNNPGEGVRAGRTARLDGGSISNNGGVGVYADKINARSTSLVGNGDDGAHTVRKASLLGCTVNGNSGDGVSSDRLVKVSRGTVITGNGLDGVDAGRVMLKVDATVAANATSAACGVTEQCDDLATAYRPIIGSGAVCGTSRDTVNGGSWGACVAD